MELVKFSTVDENKVLADYRFSKRIMTILKDTKKCWFEGETKSWFTRPQYTLDVINKLKESNILIALSSDIQAQTGLSDNGKTKEEVAAWIHMKNTHPSYATDAPEFDTSILNLTPKASLYPYQKAGVRFGIEKNGRLLLADDMGLGKTAQAIALASYYYKDWPVMIFAPASLLFNWKKELLFWLPYLKETDITVIKKSKQNPGGLITISSFDYAIKRGYDIGVYLGVKGVVIIDEAHSMKTPEAKRTQALSVIVKHTKRAIVTTGTPFLSRPIEIWPIVNALMPTHPEWKTKEVFADKYCDAKINNFGGKNVYDTSGASNIEPLHNLLRDTLMVRRLKTDDGVLDQLPPKVRITQYLDTEDNGYEALINEIYAKVDELYDEANGDLHLLKRLILKQDSDDNVTEDTFKAYKLAGLAKVAAICDWISTKIEDGLEKIIIFGHHKDFLDAVEERIKKLKLGFMRIDGTTPKEKRFKETERFQNEEDCQVAILSINAASVGLTLTSSSTVLIGEIPWNPSIAQQAECRAHRNGQKEIVTCYYAIGNGTLDGALWNMLSRKSAVSNAILDGGFGDNMQDHIDISSDDILTAVIMEVDNRRKGITSDEHSQYG